MKDLLPLVLNHYIGIIRRNERKFLAHFLPEIKYADSDYYVAFDASSVYVDHGNDNFDFIVIEDVIEWCDKVFTNEDTS